MLILNHNSISLHGTDLANSADIPQTYVLAKELYILASWFILDVTG